jgi:hypothetical protein
MLEGGVVVVGSGSTGGVREVGGGEELPVTHRFKV